MPKTPNQQSKSPRFQKFLETKPVLWLLSVFEWPRKKIRQLYGWVVGWADKPQAEKALGGIAFAESSFFPIPPDPLLIALVISKPKKYLRFASITLLFSIIGGMVGYLIGALLFDTVGQWVIDTYHLQSEFDAIGARYAANAFITIFAAAFTPIPYKLITIAAGVFHVSFPVFILASILGRGMRFFMVAGLMHHFGSRYKDKIEKYIDLLSLAFVALLILGVVVLKYI